MHKTHTNNVDKYNEIDYDVTIMITYNDLSGQTFGNWAVLERVENHNGCAQWLCRCKCGTEKKIKGTHLRNGSTKGCKRCRDTKNLHSHYGRLHVIEDMGYTSNSSKVVKCKCLCGNEIITLQSSLVTGNTKSCGCLKLDKLKARATKETPINLAIHLMKRNALNRNLEWNLTREMTIKLMDSSCFYCGKPPSNKSKSDKHVYLYSGIDRINNSKGYINGNVLPSCKICNWAKQQMTMIEFVDWVTRIYNRTIANPRVKLLDPVVTTSPPPL